jgi:methylenetetrahydrofolate dehydrogenase (NADP+)/methenyltetrahydrofolate cyclohydrolase
MLTGENMKAKILDGKDLRDEMMFALKARSEKLSQSEGRITLAVLRVGEREDDIAYESSIERMAKNIEIAITSIILPGDISQNELLEEINVLNADKNISGILLFRPLPPHLNDRMIRNNILPLKDVDGITDVSMGAVYAQSEGLIYDDVFIHSMGFAPCTAEAIIDLLKYYGVKLEGKRAVVIGRSTVIGKPVAMLLLRENATVTICHRKTKNLATMCKQADILIVAAGCKGGKEARFGAEYLSEGQIVIDVGIHMDGEGKSFGDVDTEVALEIVAAVTPVPGGLGAVTTAKLFEHVLESAEYTKSSGLI